jgi:hypothetical protein
MEKLNTAEFFEKEGKPWNGRKKVIRPIKTKLLSKERGCVIFEYKNKNYLLIIPNINMEFTGYKEGWIGWKGDYDYPDEDKLFCLSKKEAFFEIIKGR